jgi:dihydrofolate synthase / folylpolyglutamate synthase
MSYAEAVDFLFKLQQFGATFGLEKTRRLAALSGNPHERLKFIHVAGTNGKGSTCAMLESIYRHAGYKVGLYTSPHLISFTERIQINRKNIPQPDVARLVTEFAPHFESHQATFFEAVTIIALRYFEEQKVDLVIWETGLGGRLDATNIVTPIASVITNVQFDHEKWLGHTLAEIAREKAGIIKPGVPVFTAVEDVNAWIVIANAAMEQNSHVTRLDNLLMSLRPPISLPGEHQRKNSALAAEVVHGLEFAFPVSGKALFEGLQNVRWPGRFDIQGRYILDGAHNPAGARALRETLEQIFPGLKPTFIVGILADKDIAGMAGEFVQVASRIYTVSIQSDRAADAETLAQRFREIAPQLPIEAAANLGSALRKSEDAERVVITGSLHFLGEAMQHLGIETGPENERALNNWSRKSS